ncbi:hypothetical protein [Iodobacter fluviatilis]|uniref:hypothetical protein n=1 Tax=Iodobacter fluviatilis TaxID=537 RepID=UPI001021459E|nr:hypothetical protein [Iodobacter fluviatilis]
MKKNIVVILMLLHCSASFAASHACTSKVSNLYINSSGFVTASFAFRSEFLAICNLNADWKGVSPITCAGWFSILKSAVTRQTDVVLHYLDIAACNTLPTYEGAPAPFYVMLVN